MTRPIRRALCCLLFGFLLAACDGNGENAAPDTTAGPRPSLTAWAGGPEGPRVQIVVDLMDRSRGAMGVSAWYEGFDGTRLCLREMGNAPEYVYRDVRMSDADGNTLAHKTKRGRHCLEAIVDGPVLVQYAVTPGGKGRHGHQGIVREDWAAFNGRAFLLPRSKHSLEGARLRFEAPETWRVASPLVEKDGWYEVSGYDPPLTAKVLSGSCIGVGPFAGSAQTIGETEYRLFSYEPWDAALRADLETGSFAVFQWFHDKLGFNPGAPYAAVFTPDVDGERMFGGSFVNGTCFENPQGRLRAWELLVHRLAHAVNRYPPVGMLTRDYDDRWYDEGYAGYLEVVATAETGAAPDESRWNRLYDRYRRGSHEHPEWDLVMADEGKARGDAVEYLHYIKAPLITKMLDVWSRERTGKDLQGFMKQAYRKYGRFQAPFPVKAELETYLGISLDDFWETMITGNGPVVPVWAEYFDALPEKPPEPAAARVGGVPVSGDYLFYLASSGDFTRFADIEAFLIAEIETRRRLAALGVPVVPSRYAGKVPQAPPRVRYDIARLEARWPKPDLGPAPAATEPPRLELDLEHADGEAFHLLLEDERAHEADLIRHGLGRLTARAAPDFEAAKTSTPVLGWRAGDAVVVRTQWLYQPASVKLTWTKGDGNGDAEVDGRDVTLDPSWIGYRSEFPPDRRPSGNGVVTVVVEPGEAKPAWRVQRSFWQRGD